MKLGKTLVSFLALAMVFGVASCGSTPAGSDSVAPSVSDSTSIEDTRVLHEWTAQEKLVQQVYLHTELPSFKLDAGATISYPVYDGEHLFYCRFMLEYPVNEVVTAEYKQQLLDKYGEAYDDEDGLTTWLIQNGEEEYTPLVQLDATAGSLFALSMAFSYVGATQYLDGYFGHYYANKTFAELFPAFPSLGDTTFQFYDGGNWKAKGEYAGVMMSDYTVEQAAAFKLAVTAAGWHIYAWETKDGKKNSELYTKKGASGAFILDESGIGQEQDGYFIHMFAGFEDSAYTEGEIVGEDSTVPSTDTTSVAA